MAGIWFGTDLNTTALSSNVNRWMELNFTPWVVQNMGFLYSMLGITGMGQAAANPNWSKIFSKDYESRGNALVVRGLGELDTISGLADANQTDAATITWNQDDIGGAVFQWSHYNHRVPIVDSQYKLIRGDTARTMGFMQDKLEALKWAWHTALANAVEGTDNQLRATVGGWQWAVSDGVSTGETGYATYGTIDRSDSGNTFFRGNTTVLGRDLELKDLDGLKADIVIDGGRPKVGLAGKTPYNKIKGEQRGYAAANPINWTMYKGDTPVHYDGIDYCLATRGSDTVLGMFTPESWRQHAQH